MAIEFDKKRNRWRAVVDRVIDGQRFRQRKLLPAACSREEAEAIASKMEAEIVIRRSLAAHIDDWPGYVQSLVESKASWLHKTAIQVRARSKRWGGSFLDGHDIKRILERCGGRCEVTGLRLRMEQQRNRHPLAPSIDRIDSSKGYEVGNCRVVCYAVNVAMLTWGEDVFGQVATGWVINKYTTYGLVQALRI